MKKKITILLIIISLFLTTSCYKKVQDFNNYKEFKYALDKLPSNMSYIDNVFNLDLRKLQIKVDAIKVDIKIDYNAINPIVKAYGYSSSDKMVFYENNELLIKGDNSKVFFEITLPANYSYLEKIDIESSVGYLSGSVYASEEIKIDIGAGLIDVNCLNLRFNPKVDLNVGTGEIVITMPKSAVKIKKMNIGIGTIESNYDKGKHYYNGEVVATFDLVVKIGRIHFKY